MKNDVLNIIDDTIAETGYSRGYFKSKFEVYVAIYKEKVVYVGEGKSGRNRHVRSGVSNVWGLNKIHFTGNSKHKVSVAIIPVDTKEDAVRIESLLIQRMKPEFNIDGLANRGRMILMGRLASKSLDYYYDDPKRFTGISFLFMGLSSCDFRNGNPVLISRSMWREGIQKYLPFKTDYEVDVYWSTLSRSIRSNKRRSKFFDVVCKVERDCEPVNKGFLFHIDWDFLESLKLDEVVTHILRK